MTEIRQLSFLRTNTKWLSSKRDILLEVLIFCQSFNDALEDRGPVLEWRHVTNSMQGPRFCDLYSFVSLFIEDPVEDQDVVTLSKICPWC